MNAQKWVLVLLVGLLVTVSGVLVSETQASLATANWANGFNQSHDTDAEVFLDSNFKPLGSAQLGVGDYLVGGINYSYNVPPGGGQNNYGSGGVDNLNILFVLKVSYAGAPAAINGQGISLETFNFVAPTVAEWTGALNSVYGGAAPATALKTAAGSVVIVYSNPNTNFQQLPIGATSPADVLNRIFSGAGVTTLGELGFTGATDVNGNVNPNGTGEGWTATGPIGPANAFDSVTYGTDILDANVIFAIDPTAGDLDNPLDYNFLQLVSGFPTVGLGLADFVGTAEEQGTGNGLGTGAIAGEQMAANSGGAVSFDYVTPEPASCAVWTLIMGCAGFVVWRRRRS